MDQVTSGVCLVTSGVCLVLQLCFASLLATPRTNLRSVVVSLFLRVLHSFAENVLTFATTHEVGIVTALGSVSQPAGCPRAALHCGIALLRCRAEFGALTGRCLFIALVSGRLSYFCWIEYCCYCCCPEIIFWPCFIFTGQSC